MLSKANFGAISVLHFKNNLLLIDICLNYEIMVLYVYFKGESFFLKLEINWHSYTHVKKDETKLTYHFTDSRIKLHMHHTFPNITMVFQNSKLFSHPGVASHLFHTLNCQSNSSRQIPVPCYKH